MKTPAGPKPVASIGSGELVQVMGEDGHPYFSPVLMMIHSNPNERANFLQLYTKGGKKINITPSHLLMTVTEDDYPEHITFNKTYGRLKSKFAGQIKMGDQLLIQEDETSFVLDTVVGLKSAELEGVFAPLTEEGNVIIDEALVSCYAMINSQKLAHWSFFPVRLYYRAKRLLLISLETIGIYRSNYNPSKFSKKSEYNALKIRVPTINDIVDHQDDDVHSPRIMNNNLNLENEVELILRGRVTRLSLADMGDTSEKDLTSSLLSDREDRKTMELLRNPDSTDPNIHWYARALYALARFILPQNWIVS